MTSYSGTKPFSTSTPIFDLGRSFTWPTEASTWYERPRYFLMVLALAGDSTTTRLSAPPAALRTTRFAAAARGALAALASFASPGEAAAFAFFTPSPPDALDALAIL